MNGFAPGRVDSDSESSFMSKQFKKYCKDHNIHQHFSQIGDFKAKSVVERFNRTERNIIERYKNAFHTRTYIDVLPDLIQNYNTSYHQGIKTTPQDALTNNSKYDQKVIKQTNTANREYSKHDYQSFRIGEKVRIKIRKGLFDKKSTAIWSKTTHTIEKFQEGSYYVNDRVHGYKNYELLKVNKVEGAPSSIENDLIQQQENELNEEKKERRTIRKINKEGINPKEDIVNDVNSRVLRRFKPRTDLGFNITDY